MKSIIDKKKTVQMMVNINELEESPLNHYELTDIEDLKTSIQVGGLETPLTVLKIGKKKYEIISGHRRYTALKELFDETKDKTFETVPVLCIDDKLKESERRYLIDIANLEQRDKFDRNTRILAMIGTLKEMASDPDIDISEEEVRGLCENSLKISKRYANMYISIFEKADESVVDLVEKNAIPVQQASQISQLPKKAQKNVVKAIEDGAKADDVINNVREIKAEAQALKEEKVKPKKEEKAKPLVEDTKEVEEESDLDFDMEAVINELASVDRLKSEPKTIVNMDSVGKIGQLLKEDEKSVDNASLTKSSNAAKYIKSLIGSKELSSKDIELLEACKSFVKYYEESKADISIIEMEGSEYDDENDTDNNQNDYNDNDDFTENSEDDF